MAAAGSTGTSGSGGPASRSSVIPTTVTRPSRCPDTGGRYMSGGAVGAGDVLERPHEPNARQIVAGDCGLDVACRQQRAPSPRTGFESQWPAPRDKVAHEGGHVIDLGQVGRVRVE